MLLAIKFKPYGFLKKSPPYYKSLPKNHLSRVVFFQKNLTASPRQQVNYFLFFFFLLKIDVLKNMKQNPDIKKA